MKIAVIDNYDSFVYNIVRYVEESIDGEVIIFRNDVVNYEKLQEVDGILLSPGPGVPSEAGELMKVIREFSHRKPLLGVCLGHQAIAEYYGGQIVLEQEPFHGKSSSIQQFKNHTLFDGIKDQIEVGRYHSWSVDVSETKELIVTSSTLEGTVMSFKHSALPVSGVQFHPESILTPDGRRMIANWVNSISNQTT